MAIFLKRPFIQALTVSLVIHAVLLIGVVNLVPPSLEAPSEPLRVVMGSDGRSGVMKALTAPSVVAKPVEPQLHTPVPVTTHAGAWKFPATVQTAGPSPASLETKQVSSIESRPDPGPVSAQPAGSGVAAVAREGLSADELRHYRMSLASAARRFKRYPLLAKERGWEGTVEVAVNVSSRMMSPIVLTR